MLAALRVWRRRGGRAVLGNLTIDCVAPNCNLIETLLDLICGALVDHRTMCEVVGDVFASAVTLDVAETLEADSHAVIGDGAKSVCEVARMVALRVRDGRCWRRTRNGIISGIRSSGTRNGIISGTCSGTRSGACSGTCSMRRERISSSLNVRRAACVSRLWKICCRRRLAGGQATRPLVVRSRARPSGIHGRSVGQQLQENFLVEKFSFVDDLL